MEVIDILERKRKERHGKKTEVQLHGRKVEVYKLERWRKTREEQANGILVQTPSEGETAL